MAATQPNIIFIMADDHAAKAISCYGAGINETPNLDRIANEGMRFNHCYVTNSICTPSRAAIITGTHNHVNGVLTLNYKINNVLPMVQKHLKHAGYQTAMIGKWHLGEGPAHEPRGFDFWDVLPGQGLYFDPIFIGPNGRHMERGYVTDIITDKTLDFIRNRDTTKLAHATASGGDNVRLWVGYPEACSGEILLTFLGVLSNRTVAPYVCGSQISGGQTHGSRRFFRTQLVYTLVSGGDRCATMYDELFSSRVPLEL